MQTAETFLHLTATGWTAIGSIVGAASIVVLAIFNLLYLRAARQSANAASIQADASKKQAEVATQTLKELKYQFDLQQLAQKEIALSVLAEIARDARSWMGSLHTERSQDDKATLMPSDWGNVMVFVSQQVPSVETEILSLGEQISETERLLNEVVHVPISMRSGQLTGHKIQPLRTSLAKVADDAEKVAKILRDWKRKL